MPSRQAETIEWALMSWRPDQELQALADRGDLPPEVEAIIGFGGDGYHKDLWAHTKQVVRQSIRSRRIRWAALYHDLGKPSCIQRNGSDVSFHGHEAVSARMWRDGARRMKLDRSFIQEVNFLIQNLGNVEAYDPEWSDSAIRRLGLTLGDDLFPILALSRADVTTTNPMKRDRVMRLIKELETRIIKLREEDARPPILRPGLGDALCEAFGIQPSPEVGDMMRRLRGAVEAGELPVGAPYEDCIDWLRSHT